jgi:hypothetical protein
MAKIRSSPPVASDAACAIFGLMMGALQLARMVADPAAAASMLAAPRAAALALLALARQGGS